MDVVLAEDLALLRDGMEQLLTAHGHRVIATAESGPELDRVLAEHRPDVAVVDVRLPPTFSDEGLQSALAARRRTPGLPVLVLSQYVEPLYARELLADRGGGVGYLLKQRVSRSAQFMEALVQVADGGTVMDPTMVSQLLHRNSREDAVTSLSPRELEVLGLMAEGRSNTAIGERLVISEKAVGKHTANIFTKLNLPLSSDDNRRVLAVLAFLER